MRPNLIFITDNDPTNDEISLEFLKNVKKIPKLGDFLYKKLEKYKFFLEGLIAMLTHKRLRKILQVFDENTGKPKYCEQMMQWPLVKFSIDGSTFENNLTKLNHLNTLFRMASGLIRILKNKKAEKSIV